MGKGKRSQGGFTTVLAAPVATPARKKLTAAGDRAKIHVLVW